MADVCNNDPAAKVCACETPCNVICVVPGCDDWGVRMLPAELIFGSQNGKLLKTDWGAGMFDDLLTRGGWDTWVCLKHDL